MPTDQEIDPSETTPETEPPSSPTPEPSEEKQEEPTETVEELKEKLAAEQLESKRWKGRVEKANEKPKDDRSAEIKDLEWRLENKERIKLVQDEYEKLLAEGYQGERVSKNIALELAEKQAKVDTSGAKRARQDDMTTPSVTARNEKATGYQSDVDRDLGLTAEKRRKLEAKHPHLRDL